MRHVQWISASMVAFALSSVGCNYAEKRSSDQTAASVSVEESILERLNGVWRAESDSNILIMVYDNNKFRVFLDDTELLFKIGDIDKANSSVNLVSKEGMILTVKQIIDDATRNTYHLKVDMPEGGVEMFLVRKVSPYDIQRLKLRNLSIVDQPADNHPLRDLEKLVSQADAAAGIVDDAPAADAITAAGGASDSDIRFANSPGDGFVALRSQPDTVSGKRIATIPHGASVQVYVCGPREMVDSRHGHWCKVEYSGALGWAFDYYLSRAPIE